jgi:hypothetical protein
VEETTLKLYQSFVAIRNWVFGVGSVSVLLGREAAADHEGMLGVRIRCHGNPWRDVCADFRE